MDESSAVHPAQMPPPRTHLITTPTSGLERAQVKWFNRLRGFGFLTRGEGTPDILMPSPFSSLLDGAAGL
jgi:CspA family cold shock protein